MAKVCLQISKSLPALIVFEFPLIGTSQGQTAGEWKAGEPQVPGFLLKALLAGFQAH